MQQAGPANKKRPTKKKKSSILKQALDAEIELVDTGDESLALKKTSSGRKKASLSRKKESFAKSNSEPDSDSESVSIASTPKPGKGRSKRSSKVEKSICHLSSDESDGYESTNSDVSFEQPVKAKASGRKRHKITKPTSTFESSEDEFEF